MTIPLNDATLPPSPLDEVIAAYLLALESGQNPNRHAWIEKHPEVAEGLRAYFADEDRFERAATPLMDAMVTVAASGILTDAVVSIPYFGDYQLLEEIDRGGMGVVFKARQVSLGRSVALKMILSGQFACGDDVRRFRDEASAAAGLDHQNIVPIYEIGEHDGRQYFSMKLVDGSSLRREMATFQGRPTEAARLMVAVARAVHYAHQHGIIHRDLKPANILLDKQGQPHVTDFGLAKRFGESAHAAEAQMTQTGALLGTPAYMSPEQALGRHKEISTSTDVYSLGAILYEMLTSRPPFVGQTPLEVLAQLKEVEPSPPRRLRPELDRDLEVICLKCLRKEPLQRYGSAEALADDLDRWLRGEPILARPSGITERAWRWCRRNPVVAGLAGAAVFSLVLGITASSHYAIKANEKAKLAAANEFVAIANQKQADSKAAEAEANAAEARAQTVKVQKEKDRADANYMRFGRDRYVADIRLAQQGFEDGSIGRLRDLLDGQKPEKTVGVDLRGFEWHYWNRLCHTDLLTLQTHGARSVAYSPDGKLLALSGTNYNLKIVDATTGRQILDLYRRHKDPYVWCVAFSPDGKRLASATGEFGNASDPDIQICEVATRREIVRFNGHTAGIFSLSFSPDGKHLASSSKDKTVRIWDTTTGTETFNVTTASLPLGVAFSPDGRRIATCTDSFPLLGKPGELKIWDVAEKKEILDFKGHNGRIFCIAFSPDNKFLASGGADGVKLWDPNSGKLVRSIAGGGECVAFSSDGKRIASGDGAVRIWDTATGKEISTYKGTLGRVTSVAFRPDGQRIAAADEWMVKVWDTATTQKPLSPYTGFDSWYTSTAFSPDGKRLIAAGHGPIRVWDTTTGAELLKVKTGDKPVLCLAISPDGTRLALGGEDTTIKLLDAITGAQIRLLEGHTTQINGVAFSSDGSRIVSASGDGHNSDEPPEIKVWDSQSGKELLGFKGNSRQITSVTFSPDGKRIAGGITQYGIFSTDGQGGKYQKEFVSGEVQLWDAATGQALLRLKHLAHVQSVSFSPDGTRIAAGGRDSKVWDATTGQEISTLKGPTGQVNSIASSPDGKRVVTVSESGGVQLWDPVTGQESMTFRPGNEGLLGVAFSPDGKQLAAVGGRTVRIWDASPPISVTIGVDGAILPPAN